MATSTADFPPLQQTIGLAETWKPYLEECENEITSSERTAVIARAHNCIRFGIAIVEIMPVTWHAMFHAFFGPRLMQIQPTGELESLRQRTRGLFYTVREALDRVNRIAIALRELTGQEPSGMDRLTLLIGEARALEESVFHHWPSFAEHTLEGIT